MKSAGLKMLKPLFLVSVCVALSSLLWLCIYWTLARAEALLVTLTVLACAGLQVVAYIGGVKYPNAKLWPGACMVLAGPATLWNAFAGPGALYGVSPSIFSLDALATLSPLDYLTLPVALVGLLACILWAIVGLLVLVADVISIAKGKKAGASGRLARLDAAAGPRPGGATTIAPTRLQARAATAVRASKRQTAGGGEEKEKGETPQQIKPEEPHK